MVDEIGDGLEARRYGGPGGVGRLLVVMVAMVVPMAVHAAGWNGYGRWRDAGSDA